MVKEEKTVYPCTGKWHEEIWRLHEEISEIRKHIPKRFILVDKLVVIIPELEGRE